MYYIFDANSGKYLHITREQLTRRGKTIIKISKVEREADATAYGSCEAAQDILEELSEHGAHKVMDLVITYGPVITELATAEQAIERFKERGLIFDEDSRKAFNALWATLRGED